MVFVVPFKGDMCLRYRIKTWNMVFVIFLSKFGLIEKEHRILVCVIIISYVFVSDSIYVPIYTYIHNVYT